MATEDDFLAAMANAEEQTKNLAKWLGSWAAELKKLEDKRAARCNEVGWGVEKAAKLFGASLTNLSQIAASFIADEIETKRGTDSVDFTGGTGENNTSVGVTGQAWVTTESHILGFIPYSPLTSDPPSYFFQIGVATITAGVGFDFEVYNPGTPLAATYIIKWIGLP